MANETVLFKRGDSATITSTPVTDGQILFDTSGNGKMYLDNGTDRLEMGGAITVDASLSKTSTNAIQNKAVTGNILNSLAEVSAATQQNTIAGALALKEVNSSLTNESAETFNFGILDGKRGFFTDSSRGADTFVPFKLGGNKIKSVTFKQNVRTDHSASGTGYSYFILTFTLNFEYDDNDEITSINITSTGFGKKGNYTLTNNGATVDEIIYYE